VHLNVRQIAIPLYKSDAKTNTTLGHEVSNAAMNSVFTFRVVLLQLN